MIYSGHGQRELLSHRLLLSQQLTCLPTPISTQPLFASRLSQVILTSSQMNETPNARMRVPHTSLEKGDNISQYRHISLIY